MLTESYYANRILGARRILPDFEDYDVVFDSTATYAFEPDLGVHIAPDSLVLAENDQRIVLFSNGKWAFVADDGTLAIPEQGGRLILSGDGNWAPVREATVKVPGSSLKPESKETTQEASKPATGKPAATATTTTAGAAAGTGATGTTAMAAATDSSGNTVQPTQPVQPQQPEKVYYTIKKGDTLSKLAKQHHTTINTLCQLNGITTTTILRVGRKLRVK